MKDKEKQIEEMAKIMQKHYEKNGLLNFKWFAESAYKRLTENSVVLSITEHAKLVAQVRDEFEHEYKDKVVLSKEEYSELKGRAEQVFNEMTERMKAEVKISKKMGILKGSKETAEKILKELWTEFEKPVFWADNVAEIIKELAKQFGVEIKE